jgi:hypothetical protein
MRIVMKTFSTDEHCNGGADYAYVKLTPELAKVIAARFKIFDAAKEGDPEAIEMGFKVELEQCSFLGWLAFNDDAKGFLPGSDVENHYDEDGWCEIPEDSEFKGDLSRDSFEEVFGIKQEWTYMTIGVLGVNWETYPMNSSIRVQTEVLPRELIQRLI